MAKLPASEAPWRRVLLAVLLSTAPLAPAAAGARTGMLACPSFTRERLPSPTPQRDADAIERSDAINRAVRSNPYSILFLGDSLTQKWDRPVWERYFAARGALNAGVNGDRTEHLLWRLEHGILEGPAPEAVVLLIGTNDIGRDRPPDAVAEGVRNILEVLVARWPATRILLLGILPRGPPPYSERRGQVRRTNDLVRTCADRRHVFFADFGSAIVDASGRLTRAVSPDGVHLSARGYALLSAPLDAALAELLDTKRRAVPNAGFRTERPVGPTVR